MDIDITLHIQELCGHIVPIGNYLPYSPNKRAGRTDSVGGTFIALKS